MSQAIVSSVADSSRNNSVAVAGGDIATAGRAEFISFAISDDQYGVDIMAVREIKEWSNVTHLPKQSEYVRGVLNLRGVMVPIVDLRCRFGEGLTEITPTHIIIVVQIDEGQVGLLADRVLDIVSFEKNKIQPVPRASQGVAEDFLFGLVTHDNTMIALIDLHDLLAAQVEDENLATPNRIQSPRRKEADSLTL
jgi:purine-binding chemotaxis protein CheW